MCSDGRPMEISKFNMFFCSVGRENGIQSGHEREQLSPRNAFMNTNCCLREVRMRPIDKDVQWRKGTGEAAESNYLTFLLTFFFCLSTCFSGKRRSQLRQCSPCVWGAWCPCTLLPLCRTQCKITTQQVTRKQHPSSHLRVQCL